MNATATAVTTPTIHANANAISTSRTYLWLIKRELWEHRAIFIAPAVLAALIIVATLLTVGRLTGTIDADVPLGELPMDKIRVFAYVLMAGIFTLFMTFVIAYYVLDALYAERRDRSVLFWKSMPVSDTETVLSKCFVAFVAAPLVGFAFAIVTQLLVATIVTVAMSIKGVSVVGLWNFASIAEVVVVLLYAVIVQQLWYMPIWGWFLFCSSWTRRAPFLVAVVPPLVLGLVELIVLRSNVVFAILGERINGLFPLAISMKGTHIDGDDFQLPQHLLDILNPSALLMSPGLWIGMIVGGALIAATIWMRRYREAS